MFWKSPSEWQKDYRDGVPFWRTSNPPKGYHRNMVAPSREAELLTRVKIFKLKYNWYIEDSPADLVIPRFIVPKLVVEDVVLDVQCV